MAAMAVAWCESVVPAADLVLRAEFAANEPGLSALSWDTEGGPRAERNLLRQDHAVSLRVRRDSLWTPCATLPCETVRGAERETTFRLTVAADAALIWRVVLAEKRLALEFAAEGPVAERLQAMELVFPFDPRVTPTTVVPSYWAEDGMLALPLVISAPDFGQMLLADKSGRRLRGRLQGSRAEKTVDLVMELPLPQPAAPCVLELAPFQLPPPVGLADTKRWQQARRGWFGAIQPSSQWGEQDRPFSAPAGILANNVISDPASCSLWFYADQVLWTPDFTAEISPAGLVRRSLDWWLDHRTHASGEVVCYWDFLNFLDANAGPLIAAWDYVEATGDTTWLARRIERLEAMGEFLARRDTDGDGMVEAVQSGNRNTLQLPNRSCAWWDALNCGHKDGYTNALIYRAWLCLADLELQLDRHEECRRYRGLAERLKAAYAKTLFNPDTGWLAWWKSEDGELHDYASTVVNGLAIEYGLVAPERGCEILDRLWDKIEQAGFQRLDLGIPPMLVPVHRSDYLQPSALGIPQQEDGRDTFGHYMNGGITAGQTLHFLAAHYVLDHRTERADRVLDAMLTRQTEGRFQNGVQDAAGLGIDWTDWQGNPTGYEGYLADSFRFLQAVLLRDPALRGRYYRPLR